MSKKNKKKDIETENKKINFLDKAKEFYKNEYKKLLIIPFTLLFIGIILIVVQIATTGDFINKGISLKGGITLTIPTTQEFDTSYLQSSLMNEFPDADMNIRRLSSSGVQTGVIIESDITENVDALIEKAEELTKISKEEFTIEEVGSQLGESFFRETSLALVFAFIFMATVVFAFFRNPVISGAVILSAFSDIVVTIAILNLIGFKIGTAGIAALLMLISYSVDTDMLLSTRVTRRKHGTVFDAVLRSMRTGMIMTLTTLLVVTIGMIFSNSLVLRQIMFIIFIGLTIDIINTWLQNAGLIRWYYKKKKNED
jgi:preprotein translocase subunit SecF